MVYLSQGLLVEFNNDEELALRRVQSRHFHLTLPVGPQTANVVSNTLLDFEPLSEDEKICYDYLRLEPSYTKEENLKNVLSKLPEEYRSQLADKLGAELDESPQSSLACFRGLFVVSVSMYLYIYLSVYLSMYLSVYHGFRSIGETSRLFSIFFFLLFSSNK
jgi:hypothetical protein